MKRPKGKRVTSVVRVYTDQAEKLGWLFKVRGVTAAEFIGQRIAADLDAEYAKIAAVVKQVKRTACRLSEEPN